MPFNIQIALSRIIINLKLEQTVTREVVHREGLSDKLRADT